MGAIVTPNNAPSIKISLPQNFATVPASTNFVVKMKINKMQTGSFTQPQKTYYMAPGQVNGQRQLIGHTHVTMQKIQSFTSTEVLNGTAFSFFKGVNGAAVNGELTADLGNVTPGFYRICTMNGAANHQPTAMSKINHGSTDDCIFVRIFLRAALLALMFGQCQVTAGAAGNVAAPTTARAATTTSKAAAATSKAANSNFGQGNRFGQGNKFGNQFGRPNFNGNRGGRRRRSFTNRQA